MRGAEPMEPMEMMATKITQEAPFGTRSKEIIPKDRVITHRTQVTEAIRKKTLIARGP